MEGDFVSLQVTLKCCGFDAEDDEAMSWDLTKASETSHAMYLSHKRKYSVL